MTGVKNDLMMVVSIPQRQDQELERFVPAVLRGEKNASKRVRWALGEYLTSLATAAHDPPVLAAGGGDTG